MSRSTFPLPSTIFGLAPSQHRVSRVKELFAHYGILAIGQTTRTQLLRQLIAVEGQFTDRERQLIASWLQGGGLLSDLKPTLRKANALTKRILIDEDSYALTDMSSEEQIVPLSAQQECSVCLVLLTGDAFPQRAITRSCRHGSFTCLDCLKQSLNIQIREKPLDHVTCPECPAVVSYQRVKDFASPEAFKVSVSIQYNVFSNTNLPASDTIASPHSRR